jgi:hypothetical protein
VAFLLIVTALLVSACGGSGPTGGSPPEVRIDPASASVPPGGSVALTATVDGVASDAVSWSAADGTVTGQGATVTYSAPFAAGQYAVSATSTVDPRGTARALVRVAPVGEARVEIVSDPLLLTGSGDSGVVEAVVYDADGRVDPDARPTWSVDDLDEASIDEDGLVTARVDAASVEVTARYGDLPPASTTVAIAVPTQGTLPLPSERIVALSEDLTTASFQRTAETEVLQVGDVVASDAGFVARVTSVERGDATVDVSLEEADLLAAFERVVIEGEMPSAPFEATLTDDGMTVRSAAAGLAPQRFSIGDLACESTLSGTAVQIGLTGAELTLRQDPRPRFSYDSETGDLEIAFRNDPTVEGTLGTVTLSDELAGDIACGVELVPVSGPLASFWGLVSLTGDVTPVVGFEIGGSYGATGLSLTGPSVTAGVSFDAGVRYDGASESWSSFGDAEPTFDIAWGGIDTAFAQELAFSAGPFAGAKFGISGRIATYSLVGIDALEPRLSSGFALDVPLGSRYAPAYEGPSQRFEAGLGVGIGLELKGGLADALGWLGIDNLEYSLARISLVDAAVDVSPRAVLEASTLQVDDSVELTARLSPPPSPLGSVEALWRGRDVEFVALPPGGGDGVAIGSSPIGSDGTARLTWTPSAAFEGDHEIVAQIYDVVLGGIGRPFRSTNGVSLSIGGGGGPAASVVVSPEAVTLSAGASETFSAVVTGAADPSLTWDATCGTVDGSGATVSYTAPDAAGTCTVMAALSQQPSISDEAVVTVEAPVGGGEPRWTSTLPASGGDVLGYGLAVDASSGRGVLVGRVASGTALSDQTSAGGQDAFVAAFDASGALSWADQFGSSTNDEAVDVAADGSGALVVVGSTSGALEGTSAGGFDVFVRKLAANGDVTWTRQFGSSGDDYAAGVAIDGSGAVYVGGYTFGDVGGTNQGSVDGFVRKYDADGGVLWTRQYGTFYGDTVEGVAVADDGTLYAAGTTGAPGSVLGASGTGPALLRAYTASGDVLWTRQYAREVVRDVAVASDGTLAIGGFFGVMKTDASGEPSWTVDLADAGEVEIHAVATDAGGAIVATGLIGDIFTGDVVTRKLTAAGTTAWTDTYGFPGADWGNAVAVDESGDTWIGGYTGRAFFEGLVRVLDP